MGIVPVPDAGRPDTVPAGASLNLNLAFEARAVKIDNPTVQWLHLLDAADGYVPPGQMGCVVPLPGLDEIRATFEAPPGVAQQAPVTGQRAIVRAYSFWMPPSPGSATQVQQAGTGVQPGNVTVLGTSVFISPPALTLNVPAGTIAVGYEILSTISNLKEISIVGVTTGRAYVADFSSFLDGSPTPVLIDPADTQITCTVTPINGAFAVPAVDFIAWLVPPPTRVVAQPWLTARTSVGLSAAPGALNTDFTIVNGVAATLIYVHACLVNTNSGTNWEVDWWDGPSVNGLRVARFVVQDLTSVGMENPVYWDGKGRQLGVGNALIGTIVAGQVTTTVTGTVGFSRQ